MMAAAALHVRSPEWIISREPRVNTLVESLETIRENHGVRHSPVKYENT